MIRTSFLDRLSGRKTEEQVAQPNLLSLVLEISEAVSNSELENIFQIALDKLKEFYGAQNCCIHLLDEGHLRADTVDKALTYCPGSSPKTSDLKKIVKLEEELSAKALKTSSPQILADSLPGSSESDEFISLGITDGISIPLIHGSKPFGVINVYVGKDLELKDADIKTLAALGNILYGAIKKEVHIRELEEYDDVVCAFAKAVEAKDRYTAGHVERVVDCAVSLGREIGLDESELKALELSATLHDLGKIGVPEAILNKPERLTDEEFEVIKRHPLIGADILANLKGERAERYIEAVIGHHERIDGSGYPYGKKEDEIPLNARIVAVADFWDAITSDRPYRRGMDIADAIGLMESGAGSQLDKRLVEIFIEKVLNKEEIS